MVLQAARAFRRLEQLAPVFRRSGARHELLERAGLRLVVAGLEGAGHLDLQNRARCAPLPKWSVDVAHATRIVAPSL